MTRTAQRRGERRSASASTPKESAGTSTLAGPVAGLSSVKPDPGCLVGPVYAVDDLSRPALAPTGDGVAVQHAFKFRSVILIYLPYLIGH